MGFFPFATYLACLNISLEAYWTISGLTPSNVVKGAILAHQSAIPDVSKNPAPPHA
jgi:hypothetical protein